MSEETLSRGDLMRLCGFLYGATGMLFDETKRYYVERRAALRMEATGRDFDAYFASLATEAAEVQSLINSFTVNETYFYREEHQLSALSAYMLGEVVRTRGFGEKVRLWSLPCSTGEEAYSIALWLLENWRMVDAYNVEIVGSDIDTAALEAARQGRYGDRALGRLPEAVRTAYFEREDGRLRLIGDLRDSVLFTPANLVDAATLAPHGAFDVIFCRNVLIYFDDASRRKALDNLFERLNPGGFLCLGHTESLSRVSDRFLVRRFEEAVVHQRPPAP